MQTRSTLTHLECAYCGETYAPNQLMNLCPGCSKPLLARYDLDQAGRTLTQEALAKREPSLWRYEEVLPVQEKRAMLRGLVNRKLAAIPGVILDVRTRVPGYSLPELQPEAGRRSP